MAGGEQGTFHQTTIFTKRPRPGSVKTRLCPPLTPEQAARLAQAMLDDTLARLLTHDGFRTALCVAPVPGAGASAGEALADGEQELQWFRERYGAELELTLQRGGELGERLANHFADACSGSPGLSGFPRSTQVVLGSDAPTLPLERVAEAHRILGNDLSDVVLGPDLGGGYYLVGLRDPAPVLFRGIPMSKDDMYARTLAAARGAGLRVHELAAHGDVDTPDDLRRLGREVDASCPRTAAWLRAEGVTLP